MKANKMITFSSFKIMTNSRAMINVLNLLQKCDIGHWWTEKCDESKPGQPSTVKFTETFNGCLWDAKVGEHVTVNL